MDDAPEKSFQDDVAYNYYAPKLFVLDWEYEVFKKNLDEIDTDTKIGPSTLYYDLKGERSIVASYSLDKAPCPFLTDKGCKIYADRPHVCRVFPLKEDISPLILGKVKSLELPKPSLCEVEMTDTSFDVHRIITPLNLKLLLERYGDAFYERLGFAYITGKASRLFSLLEKRGEIKLARKGYDEKALARRVENSKKIGLSEMFKKYTGEDITKVVNVDFIKEEISQGRM